jgi:leader peptidase (prepilin peptidase)/N-methyltransferase
MSLLLAAILGLVHGSLLATVVLRVPAGDPIGLVRSRCDRCSANLSWFELVPLLSWLALRGRCRRCSTRIAPVHPLLEAGAMLAWIAAEQFAPGAVTERLAWGFFAATSLALLWSDLATRILPDLLVAGIAAAGLLHAAANDMWAESLAAAVFAGLLLAGVRWLFLRLRGREALGLGDVKLLAALGLWMRPAEVGPSLLLAAIATLTVALLLRVQPGREIPFGPGLLLGAWTIFIIA